jgi:hypothetical protein
MGGVLLMLVSFWAGQMVDGHVHDAPHGGKIAHLGALHLELRVDEREIQVWLLDQKMKIVPPRGRALEVVVSPKGRARQVLRLVPADDHFRAVVDLMGLPELEVTAALKSGRRIDRTSFRWTILDAQHRLDDTLEMNGVKL